MTTFKTTEWTLALAAAQTQLSIRHHPTAARHISDLHRWILLHLTELEILGAITTDAEPPRLSPEEPPPW